MKQVLEGSIFHLIDHTRFEIDKDRARHVLSRVGLSKKRAKRVVFFGLVRHLAIWLYAVLEAVKFPACVTDLHARLTNMNRYDFSLLFLV